MIINVLEYLKNTASNFAEKTAIIEGEKSITFKELEEISKGLGCFIYGKNKSIKKPIAVFLPKGIDSVISFLGILYSGNFYVPIDIESPPKRLGAIINNLEPAMIITSNKYKEKLVNVYGSYENIILLDEIQKELQFHDGIIYENILNRLINIDPVYTIYTSGSTGTPKGVVIPHRGVIDYIDWAKDCFKIDHNTIIGNQAPFYFDNSTLDIYLSLSTGATLVIIPKHYFSFPKKLIEYINEIKINFIFWVPSVLKNIANYRLLDNMEVSTLEKILFAGEVMPNKHLNYWRKNIPNALYANLYGPTEITVDCTYYIVDREFDDEELLPIGIPCRNSSILILNENNEKAEKNETGELCVRGSSLALGYWNNHDKTKSVFTQNPLSNNYPELIYRTGDLVYLNDREEIMFVGRKDSQIKHMGYRIELGEIENAVLSLNEIQNACVLYDNVDNKITLFYESETNIGISDIRKQLIEIIPKYMIPNKYYKLEKIPFNRNDKIDRKKLKNQYF